MNYIYIYAFSRQFYPKRLAGYTFFHQCVCVCVPRELNPQPFALLTQCSTTEPQEHCTWDGAEVERVKTTLLRLLKNSLRTPVKLGV